MKTFNIVVEYLRTKYLRKFSTREQLLQWQDRQVRKFLEYVLPRSQFYRDYYRDWELNNWQNLPIIDKSIWMENFDRINTVGIRKEKAFELALQAEKERNFTPTINGITVGLSSGTSGNRGLFLLSDREREMWAGSILAKALPGSLIERQKIAFFLRANSNLYETIGGQRLQFKYFDLLNSLSDSINTLNEYQPNILIAPPSMLRLLAEAQKTKYLKISPLKIVSVAEVLDPLDEMEISRIFSKIVHQIYQCTEGFLGYTCQYGTLHLNEDIAIVQKEYLDQNSGKFMPIITDFRRCTQPIVRYRLDDILTESQEKCACGSILMAIASIEGRKDDIFYFPSDTEDKLVPIFPDFIRRAIITTAEEIEEYMVCQLNPNLIELYLKIPSYVSDEVKIRLETSLKELIFKFGCQVPNIVYKEYIGKGQQLQKLRRVQRQFSANF
jgi:putative adenylate-forming enzyme